jgi:hypothetical protein
LELKNANNHIALITQMESNGEKPKVFGIQLLQNIENDGKIGMPPLVGNHGVRNIFLLISCLKLQELMHLEQKIFNLGIILLEED